MAQNTIYSSLMNLRLTVVVTRVMMKLMALKTQQIMGRNFDVVKPVCERKQGICDNHIQEALLRGNLSALVDDPPEFDKFNQVFDLFGFGLMAPGMLLVRSYPLSRFETV
ncbi:MAG: hypothetical protein QNJ68_20695 [Microcoleaceae cyanobacterium MO_207.B10]|nr:hypothetical protein [Microcoleaceae cyanobacterium MO_207.B10]